MKALYLPQAGTLQPWYDDVCRPCDGRHEVKLFDSKRPINEQFKGVDAVIDQGGSVGTREHMTAAKRNGIKLWQVLGTGVDHVDIQYLKECGLVVANTPGTFSAVALAEHCMYLMLFLLKQHPVAQRNIANGIRYAPLLDELHGQTLGLVGFGASGQELARRASTFGMRVIADRHFSLQSRLLAESLAPSISAMRHSSQSLLRQSDVVSLHVPLLPSTSHLINQQTLRCMKRNAILINVARGEIVDEDGAVGSVVGGWIRGAGVDVFSHGTCESEPSLVEP